MPHLHLSLQSGDDMILKRMKRRHLRDRCRSASAQDVRALRPDIVFGADIIAGFPTETDAMFENSLRIVEECGLTHLHVFPFARARARPPRACRRSRREIVKERAARLRAAGEAAYQRHLAALAGTRAVGAGRARGPRPHRKASRSSRIDAGRRGEIIEVDITGHDGERLIAAPAAARAA